MFNSSTATEAVSESADGKDETVSHAGAYLVVVTGWVAGCVSLWLLVRLYRFTLGVKNRAGSGNDHGGTSDMRRVTSLESPTAAAASRSNSRSRAATLDDAITWVRSLFSLKIDSSILVFCCALLIGMFTKKEYIYCLMSLDVFVLYG